MIVQSALRHDCRRLRAQCRNPLTLRCKLWGTQKKMKSNVNQLSGFNVQFGRKEEVEAEGRQLEGVGSEKIQARTK